MQVQMTVPSMACAGCAQSITKAVQTVDVAATVAADLKTKVVTVDTDTTFDVVKRAIATAGYPIGVICVPHDVTRLER
jgi:copper chaperone